MASAYHPKLGIQITKYSKIGLHLKRFLSSLAHTVFYKVIVFLLLSVVLGDDVRVLALLLHFLGQVLLLVLLGLSVPAGWILR